MDVSSPVITFEGLLRDSNFGVVNVEWRPTEGNFDVSHYTVQLYQNGNEISDPIAVNSLNTVIATSVHVGADIQAKIRTTSKCKDVSPGVFTESVKAVSGGM